MDRHAITQELRVIIDEYLRNQSLELIDLICRYEGNRLTLRILADRPQGGITLDDCAYINREIGRILDEKNIVQEHYILEVSSPGLDRPLATKNDFLRVLEKKVKFFLTEKINGKMEWDGKVVGATDTSVYIDVSGQQMEIPLSKITKAKQLI
jgi:ribosome maturation factor RimP